MNLVGRSFARDAFAQALSADAFVRAMLDFERALACAEADAGVIPQDAARVIAAACSDLRLSPDTLASDGKKSGSLAVPLVKALTEQVARADARAAAFVHYGSTSQDVLDTALVLCVKPCLADANRVLATAVSHLAGHARRHAGVVMLGRTLMQPATPITAGLKIARWAAALHRCRLASPRRARGRCASSSAEPSARWTPSAAGARPCAAAWPSAWAWARARVARPPRRPAAPDGRAGRRHGDGGQDRARRRVALAAEVGEMLESAPAKGVGGSSAMPHKRNPVACLQALAAAQRTPVDGRLAIRRRRRARAVARRLAGRADDHPRVWTPPAARSMPSSASPRSRGERRADEGQPRIAPGPGVLRAAGPPVRPRHGSGQRAGARRRLVRVAVKERRHLRESRSPPGHRWPDRSTTCSRSRRS